MDPLDTLAFARSLIDIDSTTGREARGGPLARRAAARARLPRRRTAGRARLRQHPRHDRRPAGGVLHALRLRAAVLSEPGRGWPAGRPRRLRCEGDSGGAGRGGRAAASGGRAARRAAVRRRRGARQRRRDGGEHDSQPLPVPDQRRADRQPARDGHARRAARAADRGWPGGAFVGPGAGRVGDRQAHRRARRAAWRCRFRSIPISARPSTPSA